MKNAKIVSFLLLLLIMIFSIYKGFRFPSEWAISHWLLDYSLVNKRGLIGSLLSLFDVQNRTSIIVFSFLIFGLLLGLLFSITVFILKKEAYFTLDYVLYFLSFFLSQYVLFSSHLVGYLDQIIAVLAFFILFLVVRKAYFIASILLLISFLIHEIALFYIYPTVFFAFYLANKREFGTSVFYKKLCLLFAVPFFGLIFFFYLQWQGSASNFEEIKHFLSQNHTISIQKSDSVARAFTTSFFQYFSEESPSFFQRLFLSKATIFFGLPLFVQLHWLLSCYLGLSKLEKGLIIIVVCSPLVLHSMAWDTYRIWAMPYFVLFLVQWILTFYTKYKNTSNNKYSTLFFLVIISIVFLVPSPLFDGEVERLTFPFRLALFILFLLIFWWWYKKFHSTLDR